MFLKLRLSGIRKTALFLICTIILSACTRDGAEQDATAISWNTLSGEPPLVIAHRGASAYLPGHTLQAYAPPGIHCPQSVQSLSVEYVIPDPGCPDSPPFPRQRNAFTMIEQCAFGRVSRWIYE